MLAADTAPAAAACEPGLHADGDAIGDGPARDALRLAMHQLSDAESRDGPSRPAAMCQALTEAARTLADLRAYAPAESYLAQALRWAALMGGPDLRADLHCALAEVATNAADLAQWQDEAAVAIRRARDRARDHAFEAAGLARQVSDPYWEVKLLLRASDVLDRCGDHDDAVHLQHRALVLMGLHDPALANEHQAVAASAGDLLQVTAPGGLM
jgi:hypothetical protein